MLYCTKCGVEVAERVDHCDKCGTSQKSLQNTRQRSATEEAEFQREVARNHFKHNLKKVWWIPIVIVVALFILIPLLFRACLAAQNIPY